MLRSARVEHTTLETRMQVEVHLDGSVRLAGGVPFLSHMLDQVVRHGLIDLNVECHHQTTTIFKIFGRTLEPDSSMQGFAPSMKGGL